MIRTYFLKKLKIIIESSLIAHSIGNLYLKTLEQNIFDKGDV